MTLKCKLLSVVISMDSPLPFNSTESITLCLISAAIAPEKRCRSHRGEHSAFEKSSWCSFSGRGGGGRMLCRFILQLCSHSHFDYVW